ncbi:hypothetical protein D3C81_719490 [compost metagenome]
MLFALCVVYVLRDRAAAFIIGCFARLTPCVLTAYHVGPLSTYSAALIIRDASIQSFLVIDLHLNSAFFSIDGVPYASRAQG